MLLIDATRPAAPSRRDAGRLGAEAIVDAAELGPRGHRGVCRGHARAGAIRCLKLNDSMMPQMDGFETLDRIRTKPSHQNSAYHDDGFDRTDRQTRWIGRGIRQHGLHGQATQAARTVSKVEEILARTIPRAEAAGAQPFQNDLESSVSAAPRSLQILLADDSPDNRMLIRAYLKKTPYSLDEAENGQLAYEPLHRKRLRFGPDGYPDADP